MKKVIFYFNDKFLGNWIDMYNAIYQKQPSKYEMVEKLDNLDSINITDDDYSNKFKQMYMPPFVLFYKGNKSLINKKVIGILGNLSDKLIKQILETRENDITICCKKENINDQQINELTSKNINLILLLDESIRKIDNSNINNILYLSEYSTEKINSSEFQTTERIIYALADNLFIESINQNNIDVILQNYENEKKNCFIKKKYEKNGIILDLIKKKIVNGIDEIKEIFNFKKN